LKETLQGVPILIQQNKSDKYKCTDLTIYLKKNIRLKERYNTQVTPPENTNKKWVPDNIQPGPSK